MNNSQKTKYKRKNNHAILATDTVIFSIEEGKLKVLLIRTNKKEYEGFWAVPGGLVSAEESLEDSVKKHLFEKTGIKNIYIEQLETFGDPKRDPFGRVVSVAYISLIPFINNLQTSKHYSDVNWFPINKLPKLAYDHRKIINTAIKRLKSKLEYTNIVNTILPEFFTLAELQKTYEIILEKELDKRNFRKKILNLNILKETKAKKEGEAHRPAKLYTFKTKNPQIIQIL